jgi:hypothetical protein
MVPTFGHDDGKKLLDKLKDDIQRVPRDSMHFYEKQKSHIHKEAITWEEAGSTASTTKQAPTRSVGPLSYPSGISLSSSPQTTQPNSTSAMSWGLAR